MQSRSHAIRFAQLANVCGCGLGARQLHHGDFGHAPSFENLPGLLGIRRRHLGALIGAQDDYLAARVGQLGQHPADHAGDRRQVASTRAFLRW